MAELDLSMQGTVTPESLETARRLMGLSVAGSIGTGALVGGGVLFVAPLHVAIGTWIVLSSLMALTSLGLILHALVDTSTEVVVSDSDDGNGGDDRSSHTSDTTLDIEQRAQDYPTVGKWFLTRITHIECRENGYVYVDADLPYDQEGYWKSPFPHGWNTEENFVAAIADNHGLGPDSLDELVGKPALARRNDDDSAWTMLRDEPVEYIEEELGENIPKSEVQLELVEEELGVTIGDNDVEGIVVEDLPDDMMPEDDYR